jgi:CBS domain-containing protein
MLVYQAMSTHVVAITPEESAAAAARDLIERGITGLPVIDEDGHLLGVVTEIDLLRAARTGVDLSQVTVAAVMDGRPLFVGPETDLNTAIDLMEEWQVRRLPVCVGSRLVGVVSRRDILETLVESGRQAAIPVG